MTGKPRRGRLRWTAIALVATLVLGGAAFGLYFLQAKTDTAGKVDFGQRLAIPPLAESTQDPSGARLFDLDVRAGETQLLDGPATRTWGVNGTFLGPTIRAKRGEKVAFSVRNSLPEATSLHWHGMHLPADMDGGPHQLVEPGTTWTPQWTISQQAATLWYHPHLHGRTADHLYRGVTGMFILDDDHASGLGLPGQYGVDDLPLIVQDRAFDGDNQFESPARLLSTGGVFGDEILVNGTRGPYTEVTTRLVRLRLLNASNSRLYNFGFSDDRPFQLIGTDGGLLPARWQTTRIQLSPGERAEVVAEFRPGETTELRSYPASFGYDSLGSRLNGADDRLDLVQFRAAATLSDATRVPAELGTAPDIDTRSATTRSFELSGRTINGAKMDMARIDFAVRADTTEIWEVRNTNGYMHNIHVHDVQFQVLDIDGQHPPPHLAGWKDTIQLGTDRRYRLALRFSDYTDPDTPYMLHCHLTLHEDEGMMSQFVVLGDGQSVGQIPVAHQGHR